MAQRTIHYTESQVALMVRILARDSVSALSGSTRTAKSDLRLIGAGRMRPTAGVRHFLDLQPSNGGYAWQIQ
jgi:hypothetical protein